MHSICTLLLQVHLVIRELHDYLFECVALIWIVTFFVVFIVADFFIHCIFHFIVRLGEWREVGVTMSLLSLASSNSNSMGKVDFVTALSFESGHIRL